MSSYNNFLVKYSTEIQFAIKAMKQIRQKLRSGEIKEDQVYDAIQSRVDGTYDTEVGEYLDRALTSPNGSYHVDVTPLADMCFRVNQRYGTEMHMPLVAIEDLAGEFGIYNEEEIDEDED